ncbi:ATP-binding protein [Phenylobacterium sp. LjRoot219]|uniref:AAA family ATPase n=1 Tax=Phenylobacterium sp. LjRoot219 TaxID=3342283 RepID=UPI003ECEB775
MTDFVATSLARRLFARMQDTHERRRISVFAGPPGVGKTTTIDEFVRRRPGEVVVVKVSRRNAGEILVMQHTLEALSPLTGCSPHPSHMAIWSLRRRLFEATRAWAGGDAALASETSSAIGGDPRRTVIFDEAQNLSREVIEALRYWNDGDRCYAPMPLGLIFVGNNEFSLAGGPSQCVISAAVADRALYLQTFDYEDIADEDLKLFIDARGGVEGDAVEAILRSLRIQRAPRSFRRLSDLLDDLEREAGARCVSADDVRRHFALA